MAIVKDASTPARVVIDHESSSPDIVTITTAAFTPPSGSLILALVAADAYNTGDKTVNFSDSGAGGWTKDLEIHQQVEPTVPVWDDSAIGHRYLSSAPGSITVTATFSGGVYSAFLYVVVLNGANSVDPIGATNGRAILFSGSSTNYTNTIVTEAAGTPIYGIAMGVGFGTFSAATGTTLDPATGNPYRLANNCGYGSWKSTTDSISIGQSRTLGMNSSVSDYGLLLAAEVLPASSSTTVSSSDTASSADAGTNVGLGAVGDTASAVEGVTPTIVLTGVTDARTAVDTGTITSKSFASADTASSSDVGVLGLVAKSSNDVVSGVDASGARSAVLSSSDVASSLDIVTARRFSSADVVTSIEYGDLGPTTPVKQTVAIPAETRTRIVQPSLRTTKIPPESRAKVIAGGWNGRI